MILFFRNKQDVGFRGWPFQMIFPGISEYLACCNLCVGICSFVESRTPQIKILFPATSPRVLAFEMNCFYISFEGVL